MSPNIPRPATIIAPIFSQKTSKNHVKRLTLSSPFKVERGNSFPISCKCAKVYINQFRPTTVPKTCHLSELQKETKRTTIDANIAQTEPR